MERRFALPWDRALRVSTALFVLLLLGVGLGVPLAVWRGAGGDPVALVAALPAVLAVVVALPLAWALAPRALAVGGGVLRVERPLRPVEIPLQEVRAVARLRRAELGRLVRTAGSGGAFGHYGRYWSSRVGAVRLHATRRDDYVLVDADGARHLVTPDDPAAFVAALLRAAPRARPVAVEALAPAPGGLGAGKLVLGILAAVALVTGGVLLAVAAWAPVSVTLEGDAVVVARRWAGPVTIALPRAPGAVRPLGRDELRGLRKRSGTTLGEARFGRFSSDALGPFQLHAPRWGPPWLLETPEGRVVVVPDDPEALERWVHARAPR